MKTRTVLAFTLLLVSSILIACAGDKSNQPNPPVVFLVRHAEKIDHSRDPELSPEGRERTALLAEILRSANVECVHSTDFIRTRDTAAGVAAHFGLEVESYDYRDLHALKDKIVRTGGRHLVVGHNNTTPAMVELLGGPAEPIIDEGSEYDRLYIVTLWQDGTASTILLRYGRPYTPPNELP